MKENPEEINNGYSSDLQQLINRIFYKDMEKRPSCYDILTSDLIINKAKVLGLINDIEILYPDFFRSNIDKNISSNNDNKGNKDKKNIIIYNKNRKIYIHKNNSIANINGNNKINNNININNNQIKYKKKFNSFSAERQIINSNNHLIPVNNNINDNKIQKNNIIPNKLFIKKILNKSKDKKEISKNNENGRYTNIEQKNIILILYLNW